MGLANQQFETTACGPCDSAQYLSSHPIGSAYDLFPSSLDPRLRDIFVAAILQAVAAEAKIPFDRIIVSKNCHALLAIEYHSGRLLNELFLGEAKSGVASNHSITPLSSDQDRALAKVIRLCKTERLKNEALPTTVTEYRLTSELTSLAREERDVSIIQSIELGEVELARLHRLHTLGETPWSCTATTLPSFKQSIEAALKNAGKLLNEFLSHRPAQSIREEKIHRIAFAACLINGRTSPTTDDLSFAEIIPSPPETELLRDSCELLVKLVENFGSNDVFYGYVIDKRHGDRLTESKKHHCLSVNGAESTFSRSDVLEVFRNGNDPIDSKTILRDRLLPLISDGFIEETRKHAGRRPALYRFSERTIQVFNSSDKYPTFWAACGRSDPSSQNHNSSCTIGG